MKLRWSRSRAGNWNGKRGPYTLMVVAYHVGEKEGWWVHPKIPGFKSQRVRTVYEGQNIGQGLFDAWLATIDNN